MVMVMAIWVHGRAYPNITAFHSIMLLSVGAPLTPAGGSSWSLCAWVCVCVCVSVSLHVYMYALCLLGIMVNAQSYDLAYFKRKWSNMRRIFIAYFVSKKACLTITCNRWQQFSWHNLCQSCWINQTTKPEQFIHVLYQEHMTPFIILNNYAPATV